MLITAFNRKNYIKQAINSVLHQDLDGEKFEVIVLKNFRDAYIDQIIENNSLRCFTIDGSIGKYLYEGVINSNGEIISFLDDDDLFLPNKLSIIYREFKNNDLAYYHNNHIKIDEMGNIIETPFSLLNRPVDFNMSSISIRKSVLDINAIKSLQTAPDTATYISALNSGMKIVDSKKILTYYRIHRANTAQGKNTQWKQLYLLQLKKLLEHYEGEEKIVQHLNKLIIFAKVSLIMDLNKEISNPDASYYIAHLIKNSNYETVFKFTKFLIGKKLLLHKQRRTSKLSL
ncbi:MAG: glycosyltransferase [Nitrososphaerota archaeon]|nr:glycosyltransferase [Nitrososphaerota archaeon]MDG7052104.1 glycosyltransferase [Nitrososphaerota archaeon]